MTSLPVTGSKAASAMTTKLDDGLVQFFVGDDVREGSEPVTFERLWAIAHQQTRSTAIPAQDAFLSIGLRLDTAQQPWQYYCTPKNVKTFASTGQDGVHYSFLSLASSALSESPVVMTVPMNFHNQNIVVAENLYEFLCLGCRTGYSNLEVLADESLLEDSKAFTALTDDCYGQSLSKLELMRLQVLNDAFALTPIASLSNRMRNLQSAYLTQLQMGEVVPTVNRRSHGRIGISQGKQHRPAYRSSVWLRR